MNTVDFLKPDTWLNESAGPRYVQLRRRLEQGIVDGILPPNSSLPPERELADITELSRVSDRHWKFLRSGTIGLTAAELSILAQRWTPSTPMPAMPLPPGLK